MFYVLCFVFITSFRCHIDVLILVRCVFDGLVCIICCYLLLSGGCYVMFVVVVVGRTCASCCTWVGHVCFTRVHALLLFCCCCCVHVCELLHVGGPRVFHASPRFVVILLLLLCARVRAVARGWATCVSRESTLCCYFVVVVVCTCASCCTWVGHVCFTRVHALLLFC